MDWNNINTDRDTSGLGAIEYDQSKVPALIRKHADNVRTKTYGQEVREAQARNAEYAGLIAKEANDTSSSTETRQDLIETRYDVAIGSLTEDSEVLDARVDAYGNPFDNLGNRINNIENDLASRAVSLLAYDNLKVAITDGVNLGYDYSAALEAALVDHDSVFIPPIDDLFIQNVSLKSGTTLYGVPNMTVVKGIFKNDVGNYTETIFNIESIEGVLIKNIEFDGNMTYTGYVGTSDRTKVKNLLNINRAKDVVFDNCKYTNFVSNYLNVSERVGWEGHLWAIMVIKYSENIYLLNNKLENTRLEGILAYATKNFVVDRLKSENTYLSTPLHAWYCDGVDILNSNIKEDIDRTDLEIGSTLNIYSKNVNVDNNYISGGSAIDFGNEANDPDFPNYVADNIKFHNNTVYGCINSVGNDNQLTRNVDISGNYIDATGYTRGISTGNTEHLEIHGNTFIGADEFIRFSGNYLKDIGIYDNTAFEIDRFISIRLGTKDITDIDVFNNKIDGVTDAIDFNAIYGNHAFFYLDAPNATNLEKLANIRIKENKVRTNGSRYISIYQTILRKLKVLKSWKMILMGLMMRLMLIIE